MKVYAVFIYGASELVMYKTTVDADGNLPPLDLYQILFNYWRMFNDIYSIHSNGNNHPKEWTLAARIKVKFGRSLPLWVQKIFTDSCPRCIGKMGRRRPTAGHQPILVRGFSTRGQINLIDFQGMSDGYFNFLMNYQNQGVKLLLSKAINHKRESCVTWELVEFFTLIGPP